MTGPSRTLRIRGIPLSVTESDFRKHLEGLLGYSDFVLSFVPYGHEVVATVTRRDGESPAIDVDSGAPIELSYPGAERSLLVDVDFFGITPLYSAKEPKVDIIAVAGLAGHAYESWESHRRPRMWLRDYLPSNLRARGSEVRTLTFGYDTVLGLGKPAPSIQGIARILLESLRPARTGGEERHRPIIFLGHGVGGLVIKQALVDASRADSPESDKAVLSSCVGLFFFGVPHRGLNTEDLRKLVQDEANAKFVDSIGEGSELLRLAHDEFVRVAEADLTDCQIASFYEIKDTPAMVAGPDGSWTRSGEMMRLVTEESATFAVPTEPVQMQIAIGTGHLDMIKFSRYDQCYLIVEGRLSECVRNAPSIVQGRSCCWQ